MSLWLSNSNIMRPEIPLWLEEIGERLVENDPSLTVLEVSHQRIDDTQARFLADALEKNHHVNLIILSCFYIVDDGAVALGRVFSASHTIKSLQLRDLRNSRELIIFFEALRHNKTLKEFSIRHSQICPKSAKLLKYFLQSHPSIEEFRLMDSQVIGNSFSQVCSGVQQSVTLRKLFLVNLVIGGDYGGRAIGTMISKNESICELVVSENQLGDEGITFLVDGLLENKTVTKLDIRSNGIGVKGALSLAALLKNSSSLIELHASMNEIEDCGVNAIASGMNYSSLQKIDLSGNGIGHVGAKVISDSLRSNSNLQEMNLSFNSIGDKGATSLAEVLATNNTLRCLSIRRNRIGSDGAFAFGTWLPLMRGLKELNMARNGIGRQGADVLLEGVRRNMELEYLRIEDKASEPVLREIFHWIRLNKAGRKIFRNTNLPASVWPAVLASINSDYDNIDIMYYFVRENPDLFHHQLMNLQLPQNW